jgi:hypothetical protein
MDALSYVKFGDREGLAEMLFENGLQHRLFHQIITDTGVTYPNINNLDDWLFVHNQEHESLASILILDNPFQLLDVDWNVEDDFYDWLGVHLTIHEQIAAALGV